MLLATAGTLLLIGVVVTSMRRARTRLRYESWHLLHLYGYLGVGLAIPHMLWTGADFLTSSTATVYWWTLWAVTAASVLLEQDIPYDVLVQTMDNVRLFEKDDAPAFTKVELFPDISVGDAPVVGAAAATPAPAAPAPAARGGK